MDTRSISHKSWPIRYTCMCFIWLIRSKRMFSSTIYRCSISCYTKSEVQHGGKSIRSHKIGWLHLHFVSFLKSQLYNIVQPMLLDKSFSYVDDGNSFILLLTRMYHFTSNVVAAFYQIFFTTSKIIVVRMLNSASESI